MRKYAAGVTLMELMIVVVIVGVLSAIAIPSYRNYTIRAHRVDAQTLLTKVAAQQEKYYLANNRYCPNADMGDPLPQGLGLEDMSDLEYYRLRIEDDMADLATGYVAVAAARGAQGSEDAGCAKMAINERGVRYGGPGPVTNASTHNPKCWGK